MDRPSRRPARESPPHRPGRGGPPGRGGGPRARRRASRRATGRRRRPGRGPRASSTSSVWKARSSIVSIASRPSEAPNPGWTGRRTRRRVARTIVDGHPPEGARAVEIDEGLARGHPRTAGPAARGWSARARDPARPRPSVTAPRPASGRSDGGARRGSTRRRARGEDEPNHARSFLVGGAPTIARGVSDAPAVAGVVPGPGPAVRREDWMPARGTPAVCCASAF